MKSTADEIAMNMLKSEMVKTASAIKLSNQEEALQRIENAGKLFENAGLTRESMAVNHLLKKIARII